MGTLSVLHVRTHGAVPILIGAMVSSVSSASVVTFSLVCSLVQSTVLTRIQLIYRNSVRSVKNWATTAQQTTNFHQYLIMHRKTQWSPRNRWASKNLLVPWRGYLIWKEKVQKEKNIILINECYVKSVVFQTYCLFFMCINTILIMVVTIIIMT